MIDPRTLMMAMALGNIALAGLLAVVARSSGMAPSGRLWGFAKLGEGLGFLLIGLRGEIPDFVSIPIANTILLTGFALEFAATWELLHLAVWRKLFLPIASSGVILFWTAYLLDADVGARTIIVGFAAAISFALIASAFFIRWRSVSLLGRLIGVADVIGAVIAVTRTVLAGPGLGPTPFSNAPSHAVAFLLLYFYMVLHGFGFLLLTKEEADRDTFRLATLDSLTEVFNRRAFFTQSEAALALARRNDQPLSMLMLDLDHFKHINDTHGHQTGDEVIREFVRVCRQHLRESDILARMGGEEFAVTLPSTNLEGAVRVAERIREAAATSPARTPGNNEIRFTVSIGVAHAVDDQAIDPILARADGALYEAKRQGRDRVMTAAVVA